MPRGELKLIIGNMFGNKTGRLILEIETLRQFGKRRVLVLKPDTDTRSGECLIRDYHGKSMEAFDVPARDPWVALRIVREKEAEAGSRFNLIAFDEVQFFAPDSGFFRVVDELLERGYGVLASGLALDFKGDLSGPRCCSSGSAGATTTASGSPRFARNAARRRRCRSA